MQIKNTNAQMSKKKKSAPLHGSLKRHTLEMIAEKHLKTFSK